MKAVILVTLLAVVAAVVANPDVQYDVKQAEELFEIFIEKYNRHYKSDEEKAMRFKIFRDNLIVLNQLNADDASATYEINLFADRTDKELARSRGFKGHN